MMGQHCQPDPEQAYRSDRLTGASADRDVDRSHPVPMVRSVEGVQVGVEDCSRSWPTTCGVAEI
jgi:hypothetical protein